MNVVVLIDGREAIPVRAIPLLTNWSSMSPDVAARVLAGDEDIFGFEGLQAYYLEDGLPCQILPAWWQQSCLRELKALSERLESTHAGHETQHAQWRDESLLLLPAGAFVWKDEYTTLHDSNWASRLREKRHTAWFLNRCADRNEEIDDAEEPSFMQKIAIRRVDEEFEAWRTLDFSPFIPSINRKNSVMEGFAPNESESSKKAKQMMEWLNAPREELPQESQDAFARWCEIDAIDQQMKELEVTRPVGVTEILASRAALKELHTERARLLAVLEGRGPVPAPVEPPQNATDADAQSVVMKKSVLIDHLTHEWPTIRADMSESSRNGLTEAAATGMHGKWYVEKARAWAQQEGKLKQAAPAHPLASAWTGVVTRNRL